MYACEGGYINVAKTLIENGAELDAKDEVCPLFTRIYCFSSHTLGNYHIEWIGSTSLCM